MLQPHVLCQARSMFTPASEVKAGRSGSLRSLHQFVALGKSSMAIRFDTNQPSRQSAISQVSIAGKSENTSFELLSLPLYAVGELKRLLA